MTKINLIINSCLCGSNTKYIDGTFDGTKINSFTVTTKKFKVLIINVYFEN
jgi:hypothetical protein